MRRPPLLIPALVMVLAGTSPAIAQTDGEAERPSLEASRAEAAPVLDGLLDDPAWEDAERGTGLLQNAPDEGSPASQRTEISVVFTDEALYLGVICHDNDPDSIIVADARRDSSLEDTDSIQVVLDTYEDRQTGFLFGTSPSGNQYDGQVTRESSGGFGGGGALNRNWDGVWQVAAATTETGWSAEFEIPWTTLRFPKEELQTWGFNVQRNIRRRNERSFWAPLEVQFDLLRLSQAGQLTGIEVPKQRNLQFIPYVLADRRQPGEPGAPTLDDEDFGFDVKYSLTASLTLDATYNTDFAQVEADEEQINLDRFNLFFPEKRPFFLENAGQFSVGLDEEVELFFSRRIGIGPGGVAIPIEGGVRLTGKAGGFNLGLLHMRADEVAGVAPRNDFTVARVSRDLPNRSLLGVMVVNREGSGPFSLGDDSNRTVSVDGRWGIGEDWLISGFIAGTDTPGLDGRDHAFNIGSRYNTEEWIFSLGYTQVEENFNPEVGFLSRRGYRKPDFFVMRRFRPEDRWGLQEVRPHVSYRGFWDFDGFQETGFLHLDTHWEFKNAYEIHTGVNFRREGVKSDFSIFPGVVVPAGKYDHEELQIVFFTDRGAAASFSSRIVAGGFFGGDRISVRNGFRFRISEAFNAETSWVYNDIDLPGGAFETNLGLVRASYSFTPEIFVEALMQYNDRSDSWSSNVRFAWLQGAATGLYVVYNEVRDVGSAGTGIPDRSVIVKFSRVFDLLR